MAEQDFINAGFTVFSSENNQNKLLNFIKEQYPSVIKDNEIDLNELKAILGLPIDEKVNGYGLNFVGRNFARAKIAQKTEKELHLNTTLSKNIDTTENLVLKGDNLDSLKILKNHYSGKIKCIYIDPPYNTDKDEFVYPDKFDKEEAEVLGLANLSESDFQRMDLSFKTKKSHNGWLAFMYPRLLLARDLLSKDGVIFISIDENEQANLKLLCDNDIFGEENLIIQFTRESIKGGSQSKFVRETHDFVLVYAKDINSLEFIGFEKEELELNLSDKKGKYAKGRELNKWGAGSRRLDSPGMWYAIKGPNGEDVYPIRNDGSEGRWRLGKTKMKKIVDEGDVIFEIRKDGTYIVYEKLRGNKSKYTQFISILKDKYLNAKGTEELKALFNLENAIFDFSKPSILIKDLLILSDTQDNSIILDFFAGSGTTGDAVMQLNAEDGGNRKFILCQIDEPIKKDKPAYKFCIDNNLPPLISSITIERLRRAGEKIKNEIEEENSKTGMFEEDKKQVPDIGFKVFDSVEAPKLKVDDKGQISFPENETDALSRIYNMIFTVGLDEPTQVPEEVVKDCIYKIGHHYYITNSNKVTSNDYSNAIKNGKVFIDGWTASLNATLQNYKEEVKIVF